MPICNLPCAPCTVCTAPCAQLCALLYHEASLFSQSAFVCLMLLFTSMQLKFFNIASVNTQALLHPLHPSPPPPWSLFSSHPTYASSPSAHKSLFTEHYNELLADRGSGRSIRRTFAPVVRWEKFVWES